MELQVSAEEMRKRKVFIATPMYGGMNHGLYLKSCLDLQTTLNKYGIESKFSFLFNESLITRARNYLVDEFLRAENFTHLLFIDSDIHFDPNDVIFLLAMDREIVGAPYPKKSINWRNIKQAIIKNPNVEPAELDGLVGDYVFNPVAGTQSFNTQEPLEVMEIGTGFMMVKREVFAKFKAAYPQKTYKPDHAGQANFDGSRYIHAYFDTVIDTGEGSGGSDRYLSEDYMFCQWSRRLGIKIWLCPWMRTQHVGSFPFTGDLQSVARLTGQL